MNYAILSDYLVENGVDEEILSEADFYRIKEAIHKMPNKKSIMGKKQTVKKSMRGKKS